MGNLQKCLSFPFSSASSSSNPNPLSIESECWLIAEQRTQEILCIVQPNVASEQRRKEVIDYVQGLIRGYCGTEVFPFGSVPLKTYLPDGDIDLAALSFQNVEEDLARNVCSILEGEEQNDTEFQVKNVQYIHAQVKIVKCTVQNISVDISFNQMAGLGALCFLEKVDQLTGKDHIFKRSLILIKAWCYYESRTLGSHNGLISTYALETMVLYIINFFHSSLCGPLAVLYRFLDYYSTFDWDNYCVSLNGRVAITSLPEIVVETPDNDGDELLLCKEFMRNCRDKFSVPSRVLETRGHAFPVKHFNVVDPLKDNNNLGRSVSKGNLHRVRCAFSLGARILGEILMLPGESMGKELKNFFTNTLDRNGMEPRPDIQVPALAFGAGRFEVSDLRGDYDTYFSGLQYGQWCHYYTLPVPIQPSPPSSPPQVRNKSAWDALGQLVQFNCNDFSRRNTNDFIPRLPFCHQNAPQLSGAAFGVEEKAKLRGTGTYFPDMGVEEKAKSRGTGTYFPDMTHHSYKMKHVCERERNLESTTHSWMLKPSQNSDMLEVPSKTDNGGNDSGLDLSLEEFPLLPSSKKPVPSEMHESVQPTLKSPQAQDSSPTLEGIGFGTFGCSPSPLGLPLLVAGKHPGSGVSISMDSMPVVPTMSTQRPQELSECEEEMVPVQPYQLEDDQDFPPLIRVTRLKERRHR